MHTSVSEYLVPCNDQGEDGFKMVGITCCRCDMGRELGGKAFLLTRLSTFLTSLRQGLSGAWEQQQKKPRL